MKVTAEFKKMIADTPIGMEIVLGIVKSGSNQTFTVDEIGIYALEDEILKTTSDALVFCNIEPSAEEVIGCDLIQMCEN